MENGIMHYGEEAREEFQNIVFALYDKGLQDTTDEQVHHIKHMLECTDTLPALVCERMSLPHGMTYGNAAMIILDENCCPSCGAFGCMCYVEDEEDEEDEQLTVRDLDERAGDYEPDDADIERAMDQTLRQMNLLCWFFKQRGFTQEDTSHILQPLVKGSLKHVFGD
jgi:hypothetical protein